MALKKGGRDLAEQPARRRLPGLDAKAPVQLARLAPGRAQHVFKLVQQGLEPRQQPVAGVGRGEAARGPMEQADTEVTLQRLHRVAER